MIEAFGADLIRKFHGVFGFFWLLAEAVAALVRQLFFFKIRWRDCLEQMYNAAVQSMGIVLLSQTFISLMLITEFSFHMKLILRQDSLVPAFSTVLMVRELGPVITAFLLTSRVGAGIAAEIASMKNNLLESRFSPAHATNA